MRGNHEATVAHEARMTDITADPLEPLVIVHEQLSDYGAVDRNEYQDAFWRAA
jgi:hypothetical protein